MTDSEPPAVSAEAAATLYESAIPETPKPKPLTGAEFRTFNRLAEHMDLFHNHFRHEWDMLYSSCQNNKRAGGQSIRAFVRAGLAFCSQLEFHHGIEEAQVFPMLARKMPEFKRQEELVAQHKQIHKGLDQMQDYLKDCESGEKELRLSELLVIMQGFGEVLWQHLDQEVKTLGAENMRKYWTKEEMGRLHL